MIKMYNGKDGTLIATEQIAANTWVDLIDPTLEEQQKIIDELKIDPTFIKAALDEEETSHIDIESDQKLIIVDVPIVSKEQEEKYILYSTIPIAIILTKENVITVCSRENPVTADFTSGLVRNVYPNLKTRFLLQILYRIAAVYLRYLKQIDKISNMVEHNLHKSMKNKELLQLMEIEKSLVFFSTSLKANEVTLQKILRGRVVTLYEEDKELLEDVLIEVTQAIEMCTIYRDILSGTMDAFASVISNNLNIVMKILTSITILMTVPNVVTSFYGMNVDLPHIFGNSYLFPLLLSVIIIIIAAIILRKKHLL